MADSLTKTVVRNICNEIEEAIQSVARKHNVNIRRGNCSFNNVNATLKIEIAVKDGDVAMTKEREAFKHEAFLHGLKPEHLDQEFMWNGNFYTVVGLKIKAHKHPILAKSRAGKTYRFSADMVRFALTASR